MLCVCISFPWLKIIRRLFYRDPERNENTSDMPRRCSIGSGGTGPVAKFVLESCGDSYYPGAREPNLAPHPARDPANWGPSFFGRTGVPSLLPHFSCRRRPALGAARAATEVPYLWGHCFGNRDFENVEPELSGGRNIYQESESRHCFGALQGVTERERFFDSGQGNICYASRNLSRVSKRAWMFLGARQSRCE